jgi:ParB family chromosome partitioning protein
MSQLEERMIEVDVDHLKPNPYQVRTLQDTDPAIEPLKDSISKFGVIEPPIIRSTSEGSWEIAAGHRRVLCCKLLGIPKIKCVIRDLTDEQMCETILDENQGRQSLNAIDEGKAYYNLKSKFSWTEERIGTRYHTSRDIVAQRMRLLTFQQPIQDMISRGELDVSHAEAVAMAPTSKQLDLAAQVLLKGLTVKETTERAKQFTYREKLNREILENIGTTIMTFNTRITNLETGSKITIIGPRAGDTVVWFSHAWKADDCKYNVDGLCDRFSWESEPTDLVKQLQKIAYFRKLEDGRWHIHACGSVCGRCELYEERPPKKGRKSSSFNFNNVT